MLAAQLLEKDQQEQQAKRDRVAQIKKQRAQELGGQQYSTQQAEWQRGMNERNYADPALLAKIYKPMSAGDTQIAPMRPGEFGTTSMGTGVDDPFSGKAAPLPDDGDYSDYYGLKSDLGDEG